MTERTPTDYALEFAEYMAKGAEQLIEAVNALALAEQARDEGDGDELDAKVDEARQDCTEFLTGLRNDIYQFRTRRDRAARAAPSLTVGERADGLTEEQIVTFLDAFQNDRKLLGDYEAFAGTARDIWAAALAPAAQAEPVAKPALPEALGQWLTAIGELYLAMGRPKFEATEPTLGVVETLREAARRLANPPAQGIA